MTVQALQFYDEVEDFQVTLVFDHVFDDPLRQPFQNPIIYVQYCPSESDQYRCRSSDVEATEFISLDGFTYNLVPAPATLALFGIGLAGLGWSRRKKV